LSECWSILAAAGGVAFEGYKGHGVVTFAILEAFTAGSAAGEAEVDLYALRSERVEAMRGLHKTGKVSDAELEKNTLGMLGGDALQKVDDLARPRLLKCANERV
jgi:hypothetical protein